MLFNCSYICRIYDVVDRVIIEYALAIVLLYQVKRSFTLTETRDLKTILILVKGLLKRVLKFFGGCFQ